MEQKTYQFQDFAAVHQDGHNSGFYNNLFGLAW